MNRFLPVVYSYHRGTALLAVQALSAHKPKGQEQLLRHFAEASATDTELLMAIVKKLNHRFIQSRDKLQYVAASKAYEHQVCGAALFQLSGLTSWRECRDCYQHIFEIRRIHTKDLDAITQMLGHKLTAFSNILEMKQYRRSKN